MKLGVHADTHDRLERTQRAVEIIVAAGADTLIRCGDLTGRDIAEACSVLPFCFVFGNHDADTVPDLKLVAHDFGATCLEWGGAVTLSGTRIGVVHGHLTSNLRPLLEASPEFLLRPFAHGTGLAGRIDSPSQSGSSSSCERVQRRTRRSRLQRGPLSVGATVARADCQSCVLSGRCRNSTGWYSCYASIDPAERTVVSDFAAQDR